MTRRVRLLLVAAISLVALSASAGMATAASFSISPGGNITSVSLGRLTFEALGGIANVECNVTLRGSIHSGLLPKVEGTLIGFITGVTVAHPCGGGEARPLESTLPWHMVYRGITGTLPENVTGVNILIVNTQFLIEAIGASCLYKGNAEGRINVTRTGAGRYSSGLVSSNRNAIPFFEEALNGGFACPGSGRQVGTFSMSPLQTFIRL
jgi:hypothetical protein